MVVPPDEAQLQPGGEGRDGTAGDDYHQHDYTGEDQKTVFTGKNQGDGSRGFPASASRGRFS